MTIDPTTFQMGGMKCYEKTIVIYGRHAKLQEIIEQKNEGSARVKNYKKSSIVDAPQAMTIDSAPIQTGGI